MFDIYLPYREVIGYWKALYMDRLDGDMSDTLIAQFLDHPGKICPLALHNLRDAWSKLRGNCSRHGETHLNIDSYNQDGQNRVAETCWENYQHVLEIKKKYDPLNEFSLNANILPDA